MNILQICANYPPVASGFGVYAQNLSIGLLKYGVDTTVLTFNPKNISPNKIKDNLPVKRINAFVLNSIEYPLYYPTIIKYIKNVVKEYNINVINSHTRFFTSSLYAALYKNVEKDVLLVHTEHGAGPLIHKSKFVSSICNLYDSTFGKYTIKSADVPIAIGPSSKDFMRKLGCEDEIEIIPNSINCTEFENSSRLAPHAFNEKLIITYIGRLIKSKGVPDLIQVFSEIENYYDVELWIVGNGPDELEIRELAQSLRIRNIKFLGFRTDIAKILALTNVFVNPSHYDSVPTTVIEAGCLGRRVVTTNIGDIPYIVGNDYPYLYEAGSLNLLKDQLIRVIEESDFEANSLKRRIHEKFNWEINSKKYLDLISSQIPS
jgi:glycosyltransferase involved in cell wall biosynthesis